MEIEQKTLFNFLYIHLKPLQRDVVAVSFFNKIHSNSESNMLQFFTCS